MGTSLIVKEARAYLGTKFEHKGRSKCAIDCAGLIYLSALGAGLPVKGLADVDYRAGREHEAEPVKIVLMASEEIKIEEIQEGDIVLIKWPRAKEPSHFAIVTNHEYGCLGLIHAYSAAGVVEHVINHKWRGMIKRAFRPKLGVK